MLFVYVVMLNLIAFGGFQFRIYAIIVQRFRNKFGMTEINVIAVLDTAIFCTYSRKLRLKN